MRAHARGGVGAAAARRAACDLGVAHPSPPACSALAEPSAPCPPPARPPHVARPARTPAYARAQDGQVRLLTVGGVDPLTGERGSLELAPPSAAGGGSLSAARHGARVLSVGWQRGGRLLASGSADGTVQLLQLATLSVVQTMVTQPAPSRGALVWAVCVLADGRSLVTGDSAGRVTVWDAKHGTALTTFSEHDADVSCLAVDEAEGVIYAGGLDGKLIQLQVQQRGAAGRAGAAARGASATAGPSSHWRWVYSASRRVHTHDLKCLALCALHSGLTLVSGGVDCALCLLPAAHASGAGGWLNSTPRKVPPFPHTPPLAYARAARLLLCAHDGRLQLWRLPPLRAPAQQPFGALGGAAGGPAGASGASTAAGASPVGSACHLIDLLLSGAPLAAKPGGRRAPPAGSAPGRHVTCSALSADGTRMAAAHSSLRLWRVEDAAGASARAPSVRPIKLRDAHALASAHVTALHFGRGASAADTAAAVTAAAMAAATPSARASARVTASTSGQGEGEHAPTPLVLFAACAGAAPAGASVHAICAHSGRVLGSLPLHRAGAAGGGADVPGGGGAVSSHVSALATSDDGHWLAALEWHAASPADAPACAVHVCAVLAPSQVPSGAGGADGRGAAAGASVELRHAAVVVARRLGAPASAICFVPAPAREGSSVGTAAGPLLAVTTAAGQLLLFEFAHRSAGPRLMASLALPTAAGARWHEPVSVLTPLGGGGAEPASPELLLASGSALCRVDLRCLRAADEPNAAGADAAVEGVSVPPREEAAAVAGARSKKPRVLSPPPPVLTGYRPLLFAAPAGPDELVVVERPWRAVMRSLPPAVHRYRFGT